MWSVDAAVSSSCPFAEKEVGIFRNEDNANDSQGTWAARQKITDSSAIPTRRLGRRSKGMGILLLRQTPDPTSHPTKSVSLKISRCGRSCQGSGAALGVPGWEVSPRNQVRNGPKCPKYAVCD